ncbi:hypothetical protein DFJ73DRAFT_799011 [Zopfochytrium polystomum]|nr:hypothetical protein DFJ73DRAFT_799011 [Zopfochytrium polystomum]
MMLSATTDTTTITTKDSTPPRAATAPVPAASSWTPPFEIRQAVARWVFVDTAAAAAAATSDIDCVPAVAAAADAARRRATACPADLRELMMCGRAWFDACAPVLWRAPRLRPLATAREWIAFLDAIVLREREYADWVMAVEDVWLFVGGEDMAEAEVFVEEKEDEAEVEVEKGGGEVAAAAEVGDDGGWSGGMPSGELSSSATLVVHNDDNDEDAAAKPPAERTTTVLPPAQDPLAKPARPRRRHPRRHLHALPASLPYLCALRPNSLEYGLAVLLTHCPRLRALRIHLPLRPALGALPLALPLCPALRVLDVAAPVDDDTLAGILGLRSANVAGCKSTQHGLHTLILRRPRLSSNAPLARVFDPNLLPSLRTLVIASSRPPPPRSSRRELAIRCTFSPRNPYNPPVFLSPAALANALGAAPLHALTTLDLSYVHHQAADSGDGDHRPVSLAGIFKYLPRLAHLAITMDAMAEPAGGGADGEAAGEEENDGGRGRRPRHPLAALAAALLPALTRTLRTVLVKPHPGRPAAAAAAVPDAEVVAFGGAWAAAVLDDDVAGAYEGGEESEREEAGEEERRRQRLLTVLGDAFVRVEDGCLREHYGVGDVGLVAGLAERWARAARGRVRLRVGRWAAAGGGE